MEPRRALLEALAIPQEGRIVELARVRYPGMPLPDLHPALAVRPYRTPRALLTDDDNDWPKGEQNVKNIAFTSELVTMTMHTGAHIDALGHITRGNPAKWRGGDELTGLHDGGIAGGSAAELSPLVGRAVLIDVPAHLGRAHLEPGQGIGASLIGDILRARKVDLRPGDVALVRTGMDRLWPNQDEMDKGRGAGLTLDAADFLVERGVAAVGGDTESVEQLPSMIAGNPHPVHERLLLDHGVPMIEMLDLSGLAESGRVVCLFLARPVRIAGTTAGLVDPIAII